MVLPLLKLGTLALKTLSKPIGSRLKKQAGLHPKFRNFIVSMAQANHRITTTMQRRLYGHATNVEIRPLDEEKAVQAAVDLLGEAFVFSEWSMQYLDHTEHYLQSLFTGASVAGAPVITSPTSLTFRMSLEFSRKCTVAVAALYFEVQRSSRSEAKKEELRRQELEQMRERDDALSREVESLKSKIQELEQLARGRGLAGVFNFRPSQVEEGKIYNSKGILNGK
uniref:OPA3-like protein n=1 Tax=Solanum lycopersicum TaxID=4081 RepID=A0A3Q7F5E1_SOLLC